MVPVPAIASRALTQRFMKICSTWPRSAWMQTLSDAGKKSMVMETSIIRRIICSISSITTFRSRDTGLEHLLPAEGQQLPGQSHGLVHAPLHLLQILPGLALGLEFLEDELQVVQHGVQQVVEVVGDAAGQQADRLHLLRLDQLLLELAPRGDVAPHGGDGHHLTVVVKDRPVGPGQPAPAVPGQDPQFMEGPVGRFQQGRPVTGPGWRGRPRGPGGGCRCPSSSFSVLPKTWQ